MSDTATLNILNIQVSAESQIEADKAAGTYDQNIASDSHYYLWQSDFQTVPMGVGDDPAAYVESMIVAVPGVNCVRVPFNENSFNEDGSLTPEMDGLLKALAANDIQIIPVLAVGDAQETEGTSEEIQSQLANETADSILNAWTLMFAYMDENPEVESAVYGYELLNEPAAFDQAISTAPLDQQDAVAVEMAALYVDLMVEISEMAPPTSDAKILVDVWGYAGQTDFLAETMIGTQSAQSLLEESIGEDLVWSVHFYPGWHGTNEVSDQAELEEALAAILEPLGDSDVIFTEINATGVSTYDPYADNQAPTSTALSLDFLIDAGVGFGWFPGLQTGSSGLALIEADGDIRYLNQPSLAAALDGFSRSDELSAPDVDELVEVTLVEAALRNQVSDPDYVNYTVDLVKFAGFGFGYSGNDTITGDANANNFLYGGSGADKLSGAEHDDFLYGQDGDDWIQSGMGIDHLIGGSGADTLVAEGSYSVIYGEVDADVFVQDGCLMLTIADFSADSGDQWTWLGSAMVTGMVASELNGDEDTDLTVTFSDGSTVVVIGSGEVESISAFLNAFAPSVQGGEPNSYLDGSQQNEAIDGGDDLSLSIEGTSLGELILGGVKSDRAFGRGGNDLIYGGEGNDQLLGGGGTDTVVGGLGDDSIKSGSLGGFVSGGNGADTVRGRDGQDVILGDDGSDWILGAAGDDEIYGGDGDDSIRADSNNDAILGGLGNDTLDGGSGDDAVFGESGNDCIVIGIGVDIYDGGDGTDTVLAPDALRVEINLDEMFYLLDDGTAGNLLAIESATGSKYDDLIVGSQSRNTLSGQKGNDAIYGGNGSDVLVGGSGVDTVSGGSGDDTFIFDLSEAKGAGDVIADFRSVDDCIVLTNVQESGRPLEGFSDSQFTINTTGLALDSDDRIVYNVDSGQVYFDPDGSGSIDRIRLFSVPIGTTLASSDFIFD